MKILVTGAKGFIGKNLVHTLLQAKHEVFEYDLDTDEMQLGAYAKECGFVFHLAGVNRPQNPEEFMSGNFGFTEKLLQALKARNNTCPVMLASSIQAEIDNPYGISKKAGEELLFQYERETGAKVLVYRFPNVFGKWCRPNYNSVVATFCHNIARGLPIQINDPNKSLTLVYIDDILSELLRALEGNETRKGAFCEVPVTHTATLGQIADLLDSFAKGRSNNAVPDMADRFTKKLYATYLSYLPQEQMSYPLHMNIDQRGSFTEFVRTPERGQFSVNVAKPGVVKGNHWHHTKNEKFLVVSGQGVIRLRKLGTDEVIEYHVSGEKLEVVDIPPGYTHNIECTGNEHLVTLMWANECFDPDNPDTYFEKV